MIQIKNIEKHRQMEIMACEEAQSVFAGLNI